MHKSSNYRPDAPALSSFQGLPLYARIVLDVVDAIPAGFVMSYGDIADLIGSGGPRMVAKVMSSYGGDEVPWWRVLRADGTCAAAVAQRQIPLLDADGVVWRVGHERVDMIASRWNPGHGPADRQTESSQRIR